MHMKEIIKKLSWITIAICLLCDFAMGETEAFQVVPAKRFPEILNTISKSVRDNFIRIHSWQGETEVSRYVVYKGKTAKDIFMRNTDGAGEAPNRVANIAGSKTMFSSDLNKALFYAKVSRETSSRYIDPANGRDLGTKSIPWWRISILTDKYCIHSSPSVRRKGKIIQRVTIKEKVDEEGCTSCGGHPLPFDPRDLFDFRSPVWLQYPRILEHIRENGEYVADDKYALKVEQRELDGEVQYRVHEPVKIKLEGGNIWFIKTFSSNAGYNMISWETTRVNGELIRRRTLEYQSVQGIYVPSKATEENFDPEDGSLQYQKTRTFKNVCLNHSIPAKTFTYKNLDLENGDKFIDKSMNKEYDYHDGQLIPAKQNKDGH